MNFRLTIMAAILVAVLLFIGVWVLNPTHELINHTGRYGEELKVKK